MPAILALLKKAATMRPKASSLAAKNTKRMKSRSGFVALRKDAQQTMVTATQMTSRMRAYVIIHAACSTHPVQAKAPVSLSVAHSSQAN